MADKTTYSFSVEPQCVDFTLRATIVSLGEHILNIAGEDAHRKGFGVDVLFEQNLTWVLSRWALEIDYRPEQYSKFSIRTWVNENTRLTSTRNFELLDANGNVFGRSVSQWCLLDIEKRAPVSLTDFIRICAPHVCEAPSPCDIPLRLRDTEPTETFSRKVVYSDIDFNMHVNTMRYIELMIDMLPIEPIREGRPLRMDVNFLHECRLGQTLTVGLCSQDTVSSFNVTNDEGITACRARIEWK